MGGGGIGPKRTVAVGMTTMTITRTTTVTKKQVIRSWCPQGQTGFSIYGNAAKKKEKGKRQMQRQRRVERSGKVEVLRDP